MHACIHMSCVKKIKTSTLFPKMIIMMKSTDPVTTIQTYVLSYILLDKFNKIFILTSSHNSYPSKHRESFFFKNKF